MTTTVETQVVADAMVRAPKVHPPSLTVGGCRAAFADDHVHLLVLAEHGRLVGTILRADLPDRVGAAGPALAFAVTEGRVVAPSEPLGVVHARMLSQRIRRLAVVDASGRLLGLLCLKRHGRGFCSDADIAARASECDGCP